MKIKIFSVLAIIAISSIVIFASYKKSNIEEDIVVEYISFEEAEAMFNKEIEQPKNISKSSSYRISNEGKAFIKKYEKCHLEAYPDLGGGYTIGWGHHGKDVKKNMKISQKQADKYFEDDIKKTENYARLLIKNLPYKYEFSQEFFDVLCDLIYNAGIGKVKNSTFYSRLQNCRVKNGQMNRQDYDYTISSIKNFSAPYKGHKIRRNECYTKIA